ncbi:MAG: CDP-alcohol phosphatidyltransferase family protein [Oscillospiraceae bacterium]|nr:CDP-alcohol phosphatidyltransferase family protein [Oscillospiraceae bacterium]
MRQNHSANIITAARIVLSVLLLTVKPLSIAFIVIYLLCGFSDVLDGYIARKTHTESMLGSRLDSAADFVMTAVILVVLYRLITISTGVWLWVAAIALIRFAAMGIVWVRFGKPAMLHTYANKATGILFFLFPLSLTLVSQTIPIFVLCSAATLSAAEELLINIICKSFDENRKSLLSIIEKDILPLE